ncbi:MAG: histidine kinase [Flavobacteriaceae bacterium]|jgi:hypothetical protein|nr:histidine kinase [Flavobacteriaceae bacterium]
MKQFFLSLFLLFPMIYEAQTAEQTAEQIIEKHLEVTGGVEKWKDFRTSVIYGMMVLGNNEKYPLEIYQKRPNLTKTLITVKGKQFTLSGYNGKEAVQFDSQTGELKLDPNYNPEAFESDLLDFANKGFQAVLQGNETVNGSDCFKIQLSKDKAVTTYYFDTKTYQLVKETTFGQSTFYSDFKEVSGLTFPFKIEEKNAKGKTNLTLIISLIGVNKTLSSKTFKF